MRGWLGTLFNDRASLPAPSVIRPSRALLAAAAIALSSLPAIWPVAAWSQLSSNGPPPEVQFGDENGVDLKAGTLIRSYANLSIGSVDKPVFSQDLLAFNTPYKGAPPQSWMTMEACGDPGTGPVYCSVSYYAQLGNITEKFSRSTGKGNRGSQSVQSVDRFTITTSDGSVWTFLKGTYTGNDPQHRLGYLTEIRRPDGEVLTYAGGQAFSSLGYAAKYELAGNGWKVTFVNSAVDGCDPTIGQCSTFSQSWPSGTYAQQQYATDALGRTYTAQASTGTTSTTQITTAEGRSSVATSTNTLPPGWTGTSFFGVTKYESPAGTYTYGYSAGRLGTNEKAVSTSPLGYTRTLIKKSDGDWTLTDENGLTTEYLFSVWGYDTGGPLMDSELSVIRYPSGATLTIYRDTRDNIYKMIATPKPGSTDPVQETTWNFDVDCVNPKTCNKPNFVIDSRGNRTDYTYDPTHGGVISVKKPAGPNGIRPEVRYSYMLLYPWYKNPVGQLISAPNPVYRLTETSTCNTLATCAGTADETKTTYAYGVQGQPNNLLLTSVTVAAGDGSISATTQYSYDAVGNIIAADGPLPGPGDTTYRRYDAMRQLVGEIQPDPDGAGSGAPALAKRYTYDLDGLLTNTEIGTVAGNSDAAWQAFAPAQTATTTFDTVGRKIRDAASASGQMLAVTQYAYDADSRMSCMARRMNLGDLPTNACTPGAQGGDGPDRITVYTYDPGGRRTAITVGYGTSAVSTEISTYTNDGLVETVADGNGNLTTYEYDGFNRLVKERFPNPATAGVSSITDYNQYGYDAAGNRTSWRKRDGTSPTFAFDALNRASNGVRGETYAYDNLDRRTSASLGTQTSSAAYDALGRMTTETTNGLELSYKYDLAGRRTQLIWPDGFYASYEYDAASALKTVRERGAGLLLQYSYDDLSRLKQRLRGNGTSSNYAYDAASRLSCLRFNTDCSVSGPPTWAFAYNVAGQVKSRVAADATYEWTGAQTAKTYGVNGLNQMTSAGGASLSYDARGNLATDGQSRALGYDIANNLTSAGTVTLAYEPAGRLWSVSTGTTSTQFLYSGPDLVAEYSGSTLLRRYVPGLGLDTPEVWYEGADTSARRYLQADARGSIIAVTNDAGTPITTSTYDEYGVASGNVGRFQYTGQIWLPEVGVFHYKARAYSPTLGRFLQTDPIGYKDGLNWYAYVGNDPLNRTDPTGLFSAPQFPLDRDQFKNGWVPQLGAGKSDSSSKSKRGTSIIGFTLGGVWGVPKARWAKASGALTYGAVFNSHGSHRFISGSFTAGPSNSSKKGEFGILGFTFGHHNGDLEDTAGIFLHKEVSGGAGLAGSWNAFHGTSADGLRDVQGSTLTIGYGDGVSAGGGLSNTAILPDSPDPISPTNMVLDHGPY
jgi:RHS repeat-associated protein